MSDLCHNCGDCHLGAMPSPCAQTMNNCTICGYWGHTYNFCPMGVHKMEPGYLYWMLCHNCDKWHLPTPCTEPFKQCGRCGNMGHLEYFCAAHPKPRPPPGQNAVAATVTPVNKPCAQPHFPPGMQFPVADTNYCNPHFIATLQANAVTDAMAMLSSGLPMQQVMSHFWPPGTRPTLHIPRVVALAQPTSMPSAPSPAAEQPRHLPQPMQSQHHHHAMPQRSVDLIDMGSPDSEPAAKRRRSSTFEENSQGDSAIRQGAAEQALDAEDNQTIAVSATVSPETRPAEGSDETAPQGKSSKKGAVSKRKVSGGTRCSDCVRQHKKCKHNGNDGQQSREQSVSAPEYTQAEEGQLFHAQPSAGMQAPGQLSSDCNDDVFGGNHQMTSFAMDQKYPGAMGRVEPLQPHEHAELQKILALSQAAGRGPAPTAQRNESSRFEQNTQVNWAGGAVQQHSDATADAAGDRAMYTATTKPAPKKRGGGRKKI